MKKVIIFLILLSIKLFGAINASTTRLYEKREIVGGRTQNLVIVTSKVNLTGLGGLTKLSYDFGRLAEGRFIDVKNNYHTESLRVKKMEINSSMGNVDEEKKEITGFGSGNLDLSVVTIVEVRADQSLSGLYRSPNLSLNITGHKNNHNEKVRIDIDLEINVLKSLKIKTTPMNFGVGIQGQKMSTVNSTNGILDVEGEKDKNIIVSYPKEVEIKNSSGEGVLKVLITTPGLEPVGGDDHRGRIGSNGRSEIIFRGDINDTKNAPSGKYSGDLTIKVRYD